MKDLIEEIIEKGSKLGADFIEARVEDRTVNSFRIKNDDVETSSLGTEKGLFIRVLVDGSWGTASIDQFDKDGIQTALENAVKIARGASKLSRMKTRLAEIKSVEDKVKVNIVSNPIDVSPEEKIETLLDLSNQILKQDERVIGTEINYADILEKRYYGNSDGAYIEQERVYVWSRVIGSAKEEGKLTSSRYEAGTTDGYTIWKYNPIESVAKIVVKRLKNQLKAKSPKGGEWPTILSPEVVGVFTHEAFGHLSEADLTFYGAVTIQKIGQKIASDLVTIVDDGTLDKAFGSFAYDDEGVKTEKTVLVKDGVLVGLLYNREFAARFEDLLKERMPNLLDNFNVKPTGNARAESFRFEPIIRMRNTFIQPRDYSLDEMFEDIKFGYYLKSFRGGQANLDGTFQVGIQEAYEIVDGDIREPIKNVSISGNTLETLLQVDAVGKDFMIHAGRCGKGQTAFVGDGGPHVRVKKMVIGGEV